MSEPASQIPRNSVLRTPGVLTEILETLTSENLFALREDVEDRLARVPNRLNSYKYDPWGFHPERAAWQITLATILYRYWFRVENHGIEHLPSGRYLVAANHAGQLPFDGAMLVCAALLDAEPPRILRGMAEYWVPTLPWVNVLMHRLGSVVGTPKNCSDLLANDEAVMVFPEGVRGLNKLFRDRYRLREFGQGFLRLALEANAPIVPVAIVGSEEQAPAVANLEGLARRLGLPALPITLTWPWLGPLGLVPLPVKYHIVWGEPMHFDGDSNDDDAIVQQKVDTVRSTIQKMLDEGIARRRDWFT